MSVGLFYMYQVYERDVPTETMGHKDDSFISKFFEKIVKLS